jgi:hypothetical protein
MPRPALLLALSFVLAATPAIADELHNPEKVAAAQTTSFAPRGPQQNAEILVRHADELGPSYKLDSITYSVGSQLVGRRSEFETRPALRKIPTDGPRATVFSGPRDLTVQAVIRGRGAGQFSYLNRYRIAVTGTCQLSMLSDMTTTVDVIVTRKAGVMAEFEDGFDIECRNVDIE